MTRPTYNMPFLLLICILMYLFFRQKLKHKLQWQLLMPILTWTIPTKNTKNVGNKFWDKEGKIRWHTITTWRACFWSNTPLPNEGTIGGQLMTFLHNTYPFSRDQVWNLYDRLPNSSFTRSYWMPPAQIISFLEHFHFILNFLQILLLAEYISKSCQWPRGVYVFKFTIVQLVSFSLIYFGLLLLFLYAISHQSDA